MADELIDVLADDLIVIKTCLKSEAHKNGWFHASVHIWFFTDNGDILIQKRSKDKIAFPDLWDVSVAGHISAGEDEITSALREIEEEIGLKISKKDLFKIGTFKEKFQHKENFIDNELHHIFLCKLKTDVNLLKIQKEELSDIKLISVSSFKKVINGPSSRKIFVPHYSDYYGFVINKINLQINT